MSSDGQPAVSLVRALVSGALDPAGVATNASFEFLRFVGGVATQRLKDRMLRRRVLAETRLQLEQLGMPASQAAHLVQVVEDKRLLERGADSDLRDLTHLVRQEVGEAGYLRQETDWLYQCLVQAVMKHLAGNALMGSALAGVHLALYPTPIARETLFQFGEAMRNPEKFGATLLSRILVEAGQHEAQLAVDSGGRLRVTGRYSFQVTAEGEDAGRLHDAMERVRLGEPITLEASRVGAIKFTTGHAILDRIMGFDRHPTAVSISPQGHEQRKRLFVRAPGVGEATTEVLLRIPPDRKQVELVFAERAAFRFELSMSPTLWTWHFHVSPETAPLLYADRAVLRFLQGLTVPGSQVFDAETGEHLFKFGAAEEKTQELHETVTLLLTLLDVRHHVETNLPSGRFVQILPEDFGREEGLTLHEMAAASRGELEGREQKLHGQIALTRELAEALENGRELLFQHVRMLALPGATPLELVKSFVNPKVILKQGRRRVRRGEYLALVGQPLTIELHGEVEKATIQVATVDAGQT